MSAPEQRAINLSRVKNCGQDWDSMPQVAGGRQCLHCDKRIIDMTSMSPAEIARVHLSSVEPVCGRYTDEQLTGAPRRPERSVSWRRSPVMVSLVSLLLIEPNDSVAQGNAPIERVAGTAEDRSVHEPGRTTATSQDGLMLRGRVLERAEKELQGVAFVNVVVVGTNIGAVTDHNGGFILDLSQLEGGADFVTVEAQYIGHARQRRRIVLKETAELVFDFTGTEQREIVYAVKYKRPPMYKRVWWGIKGLFTGER